MKKELGAQGEDYAIDYLRKKGWIILDRNWRYKRAEVDIIAQEKDILVFVEVKTRSNNIYLAPEASVSNLQMSRIINAASAYMIKRNYEWEFRFDIIGILIYNNQFFIDHQQDAFFPEW